MTAKEYTCYYAKVPRHDLPMAVEVLADMFTSSLLDPEEFETERGVILEELAMADDDPSDVVSERFFEAVLGDHPLGRPIGGSPETIGAVDPRRGAGSTTAPTTARRTSSSRSPAPSTTTSSSRWVTRALETAGWDLVARGRAGRAPRRRADLIERGDAARRRRAPDRAGEHPARRRRPRRHRRPRASTLSVLNSVLGGGMSSRLFQEVREKRGLAYSVYSFAAELLRCRPLRPLRRLLAARARARSPS